MKTEASQREDVLRFLRENKPFLSANFGVKSIALFGSLARGNPQKDSDIDIFVELSEPSFSHLMGCILFLEKSLGTKVDVVRKGPHLRKQFLETIQKEMIYA